MKREFKGTKGEFKNNDKGWKAVAYGSRDDVGFATHEIHWSEDGECVAEIVHEESNAKLIASAPNLLEALQSVLEWSAHFPEAMNEDIERANEAISKALD